MRSVAEFRGFVRVSIRVVSHSVRVFLRPFCQHRRALDHVSEVRYDINTDCGSRSVSLRLRAGEPLGFPALGCLGTAPLPKMATESREGIRFQVSVSNAPIEDCT